MISVRKSNPSFSLIHQKNPNMENYSKNSNQNQCSFSWSSSTPFLSRIVLCSIPVKKIILCESINCSVFPIKRVSFLTIQHFNNTRSTFLLNKICKWTYRMSISPWKRLWSFTSEKSLESHFPKAVSP